MGPERERSASRRIWAKGIAGGISGLVSYALLLPIHSPWEEALAATLLGGAVGLVDRSTRRASLAAGSCLVGWLIGSLIFGVWLDLGIGAWIVAGAFLAATAAGFDGPRLRMVPALLVGALAGALAEASRYLTLAWVAMRGVDMQFLVLTTAGVLLGGVAAVAAPRRERHA